MELLNPDLSRRGWKLLSSSYCCLGCVVLLVMGHPSGEWEALCPAVSVAKPAEHIGCFPSLLGGSLERGRAFQAHRKPALKFLCLLAQCWKGWKDPKGFSRSPHSNPCRLWLQSALRQDELSLLGGDEICPSLKCQRHPRPACFRGWAVLLETVLGLLRCTGLVQGQAGAPRLVPESVAQLPETRDVVLLCAPSLKHPPPVPRAKHC